ncbi:hypothetical protein AJ78_06449 [Emergomyces pasteurianus Ep9510]|uniref:NTF2 domain-containing protein n=1 Tax=Emergomyces pasteurianus Ep9510 TaxID=1447872 RepID=A0A1J9P8W7_9EURO|nr:hypothetical protein AJ78_06449 [Emergomyces pasteurianus Ep9510]
MAQVTEDTLTKISTDAATDFVQSFYPALQSARNTIASYYAPTPTLSKILFNGNVVADGPSVQEIFTNQMPPAHYEVQSYDCQIINPNYPGMAVSSSGLAASASASAKPLSSSAMAKNMSILVTVNGLVRFGELRDPGDMSNRGFSETFVLVPDAPADGGGPRARAKKHWLIQSQNFRLVV